MTAVLYVEDTHGLGELVVHLLEERGVDTLWVTNAGLAELALSVGEFDWLVCDYDLGPRSAKGTEIIDGYEGRGKTILFSALGRDREILVGCQRRRPDRFIGKENLGGLLDLLAGGRQGPS